MYSGVAYPTVSGISILSAPAFVESEHTAAELVRGIDVFGWRVKETFAGSQVEDVAVDIDGSLSVEIPVGEIEEHEMTDEDVCRFIETVADGVGYGAASSAAMYGAG